MSATTNVMISSTLSRRLFLRTQGSLSKFISSKIIYLQRRKASHSYEPDGVSIPTQLDSNQVESDQGLSAQTGSFLFSTDL